MKETVLLYNFNDKDRLMKIRQALLPLGFRVKTVGREDYGKPLGTLAGVKGMEELTEADHSGDGLCSDFDDEMAVLAGLTSSQVDSFIRTLRKKPTTGIVGKRYVRRQRRRVPSPPIQMISSVSS